MSISIQTSANDKAAQELSHIARAMGFGERVAQGLTLLDEASLAQAAGILGLAQEEKTLSTLKGAGYVALAGLLLPALASNPLTGLAVGVLAAEGKHALTRRMEMAMDTAEQELTTLLKAKGAFPAQGRQKPVREGPRRVMAAAL